MAFDGARECLLMLVNLLIGLAGQTISNHVAAVLSISGRPITATFDPLLQP
jgi:hypothetical protein